MMKPPSESSPVPPVKWASKSSINSTADSADFTDWGAHAPRVLVSAPRRNELHQTEPKQIHRFRSKRQATSRAYRRLRTPASSGSIDEWDYSTSTSIPPIQLAIRL